MGAMASMYWQGKGRVTSRQNVEAAGPESEQGSNRLQMAVLRLDESHLPRLATTPAAGSRITSHESREPDWREDRMHACVLRAMEKHAFKASKLQSSSSSLPRSIGNTGRNNREHPTRTRSGADRQQTGTCRGRRTVTSGRGALQLESGRTDEPRWFVNCASAGRPLAAVPHARAGTRRSRPEAWGASQVLAPTEAGARPCSDFRVLNAYTTKALALQTMFIRTRAHRITDAAPWVETRIRKACLFVSRSLDSLSRRDIDDSHVNGLPEPENPYNQGSWPSNTQCDERLIPHRRQRRLVRWALVPRRPWGHACEGGNLRAYNQFTGSASPQCHQRRGTARTAVAYWIHPSAPRSDDGRRDVRTAPVPRHLGESRQIQKDPADARQPRSQQVLLAGTSGGCIKPDSPKKERIRIQTWPVLPVTESYGHNSILRYSDMASERTTQRHEPPRTSEPTFTRTAPRHEALDERITTCRRPTRKLWQAGRQEGREAGEVHAYLLAGSCGLAAEIHPA
ncbi:hypothetical protein L226DRAFT_525501 [Lentinus tigrinus ALCF2SS1-7]|uniref:uncharacterized protein n=1 Tax=Lentinus tigrinus ALCF2SS1-7 TaxID=1328758 RepID=UPI001165EF49|nr:hypothetical protein L226DRAFT_525501 [Lentinus tigrinus ALCF2SS1-7]